MAQQQLDLFDWRIDPADDQFFVIEVLEEPTEGLGYPLDMLLAALRTVYGYFIAFLIVFAFSSWFGMAVGDGTYLAPLRAMNSVLLMLYAMLVVPIFWPFLLIQVGCFFFPIRRGTTDAMVLSLVVLMMINCIAFCFMADMIGTR